MLRIAVASKSPSMWIVFRSFGDVHANYANWFAICFPGGRISSGGTTVAMKDAAEPHVPGMPLRQVVATRPACQILCVQANFIKWRAQWKDGELSSRLCLRCWGSSVGDRDKHIRIVMLNLNWTVQTVYPNDCWLTDKSTLKYIESFGQSLRIQIYPESPWSRNVGDAVGVGTRAVIAHTKYIQVL